MILFFKFSAIVIDSLAKESEKEKKFSMLDAQLFEIFLDPFFCKVSIVLYRLFLIVSICICVCLVCNSAQFFSVADSQLLL